MNESLEEQFKLISRGVEEIIPERELRDKIENSIKNDKPLIVKLGCDPSRPDLHIGHSVVLRKLRHFQDLGHQAVLVIGDFTAMIGDPTGRNKTRPQLTIEDARDNARTYLDQAGAVLNMDTLRVVYNSKWLNEMSFSDVIKLSSSTTVARMLERDDFNKRFTSNKSIAIHEFLYPLVQGYDSVALQADVECGGTDQKFNLLVGRELQRDYEQDPQVVITVPILEGLDGEKKMSKSLDNYIAIDEEPNEMFGKIMSISDDLMWRWFELLSFLPEEEISKLKNEMKEGMNPRDIKFILAEELVDRFHKKGDGNDCKEDFLDRFQKGKLPEDIETFEIDIKNESILLVNLLKDTEMISSVSEGNRLIKQGGIKINQEKVLDIKLEISKGSMNIYQVGKRKFLKIKVK